MINISNVIVASPEMMRFIIEGMRNPLNSWDKSDSEYYAEAVDKYGNVERSDFLLGYQDHKLMAKLSAAGTDHRKFMRMVPVYVRITAPLYWWKEFDTYKVGTVANSCSTMHKIHEKEFTLEDFSCEHLYDNYDKNEFFKEHMLDMIDGLNHARQLYLQTGNKEYWYQIIQLLPSSYNQTRNVTMNYEVLANIYKSRKNHKLDEWRKLCKFIEKLPYSELICGGETLKSFIKEEIKTCSKCAGKGIIPLGKGLRGFEKCPICNGSGNTKPKEDTHSNDISYESMVHEI